MAKQELDALAWREMNLVSLAFMAAIAAVGIVSLADDLLHGRLDEVVVNALLIAVALTVIALGRRRGSTRSIRWGVVAVLCADITYLIAIGAGAGAALFWLFIAPPVALYFLGLRAGLAVSGALLCMVLIVATAGGPALDSIYTVGMTTRFTIAFMVVTTVAAALEYARRRSSRQILEATERLEHEKARLETALEEIRVLKGMLPICSCCKRVRDEDRWHPIEEYIEERSEADVTHSLCPTCTTDLYPDLFPDSAPRTTRR